MLGADPNLGEQLILVEREREALRRLWLDMALGTSYAYVTNPAQTETGADPAFLGVGYASISFNALLPNTGSADMTASLGGLYQTYRYGFPDKDDKVVDGGPVDRLDFEALGAYAEIAFQWERWKLVAELQYNNLLQGRGGDDTFYEDVVPYLALSYEMPMLVQSRLIVTLSTGYHFSNTESAGLLPDDWNDRWSQRLNLQLETRLAQDWWLMPSVRFGYTEYTANGRHREDFTVRGAVSLYWFISDYFYLNASTSGELRDSSEALTDDYQSMDVGLGASANVRF